MAGRWSKAVNYDLLKTSMLLGCTFLLLVECQNPFVDLDNVTVGLVIPWVTRPLLPKSDILAWLQMLVTERLEIFLEMIFFQYWLNMSAATKVFLVILHGSNDATVALINECVTLHPAIASSRSETRTSRLSGTASPGVSSSATQRSKWWEEWGALGTAQPHPQPQPRDQCWDINLLGTGCLWTWSL